MSSRASQVRPAKHAKSGKQGAHRQLKVVRSGNRRGLIKRGASRRVAPVVVVGAIMFAATIFGVLLMQVVLAQTGFKMATMREQTLKAEAENARLVLRAAKLANLERIERVAKTRLGMVSPDPAHVRYIVADIKTRGYDYLAQEPDSSDLLPDVGTAAGIGEVSP
jgi:cell division protein FtsL